MTRIIQIIVILVFVGILVYRAIPLIRRFRGAFKQIHRNENANLSTGQYRKLALGAIYSEQQSAYINSLTTGIPASEIKSMLSNWWGVQDGASAKETLDGLLDNARHPVLPMVLSAYSSHDTSSIAALTDEKKKEKAESQLANLAETLADLQADGVVQSVADVERLGTDGWELGRLVYVARMCFDAGLISEAETWAYIDEADQLARARFSNWADFGHSYAIGRALWSGKDSANSGIAHIAKYLLSNPESPWTQLDWA